MWSPFTLTRRIGDGRRLGGTASGANRDGLLPRLAYFKPGESRLRRSDISHGEDGDCGEVDSGGVNAGEFS
jgi:hypothetical protein